MDGKKTKKKSITAGLVVKLLFGSIYCIDVYIYYT